MDQKKEKYESHQLSVNTIRLNITQGYQYISLPQILKQFPQQLSQQSGTLSYVLKKIQLRNDFKNVLMDDQIGCQIAITLARYDEDDRFFVDSFEQLPDTVYDLPYTFSMFTTPFYLDLAMLGDRFYYNDGDIPFDGVNVVPENGATQSIDTLFDGEQLAAYIQSQLQDTKAMADRAFDHGNPDVYLPSGSNTEEVNRDLVQGYNEYVLRRFAEACSLSYDTSNDKFLLQVSACTTQYQLAPESYIRSYQSQTNGQIQHVSQYMGNSRFSIAVNRYPDVNNVSKRCSYQLVGADLTFFTLKEQDALKQQRLAQLMGMQQPSYLSQECALVRGLYMNRLSVQPYTFAWAQSYIEKITLSQAKVVANGLLGSQFGTSRHQSILSRYSKLYIRTTLNTGAWNYDGSRNNVIQEIDLRKVRVGSYYDYEDYNGRVYQIIDHNYNNAQFQLTDENGQPVISETGLYLEIAFFFKKEIYS